MALGFGRMNGKNMGHAQNLNLTFEAALNLKKKVNLLQILRIARIEPDDGFYSLENIVKAIIKGIGHTPRIGCNKDSDGNSQLYQIYFCVDSSGAEIIEYPVPPKGRCASIKYHDTDKRLNYGRLSLCESLHLWKNGVKQS
nr:ribonuclease 1-like [Quercus suber]